MLRFVGIADQTYYLSPNWKLNVIVDRMNKREDDTFGKTKAQIVFSLIAAATFEFGMRAIAIFKKNVKILDASANSPEQLSSKIV